MADNYLIYHPERISHKYGNYIIHHDQFGGNEDPYLWNDQFLHTYCHITQLPNKEKQINFWVSGNSKSYPNFTRLFCDCVFVIDKKEYWVQNNIIDKNDKIVDSDQAFEHHYKWVNPPHNQHPLLRRKRYTLKADKEKSFQPQDRNGNLINILPFLESIGLENKLLIKSMTSKMGSRPFKLPNDSGEKLYEYLIQNSEVKIYGNQIKKLHP